MRPPRPRLLVVTAALLAGGVPFPGDAVAQGTMTWSQFQGGPDHTGAVTAGPEPGYATVWTAAEEPGGPRDAYGLSAPVIGDGVAVAAGPTRVVAFDLSTGEVAWQVERVLGPSVAPAIAPGLEGDLVLFTEGWGDGPSDASETPTPPATATPSAAPSSSPSGPADETQPRLVAQVVGEDDPLWNVDLPDVSRSGVTVAGGLALATSIDGSVTAVEIESGDVAWTVDAGEFVDVPTAATADLALVSVRGDREVPASVVALSLTDGSERWRYEPSSVATYAGPASTDGDLAFVALDDRTVRAISVADGSERWRADLNAAANLTPPASPPTVLDDGVIVADLRGQLYHLDRETGLRTWDHALNRVAARTSPVVVGAYVLLATTEGTLAAFETTTGDRVWEETVTDADGGSSTAPLRSMAVDGDVLVVVRGGAGAGMVGLAHDADAVLTRQESPTILDPAALVFGWVVGLVVAALLFLLGRALSTRIAPVDLPVADVEPVEDA